MKEFNNLEEMEKYKNEDTNAYEFIESGFRFDVKFNFNLKISSNIKAGNIKALDIKAGNIDAANIDAWDIGAWDIDAWDIKAGNIDAGNIKALDIKAGNIKAWDIDAWDIDAGNIKALDISFWAFCISYTTLKCKYIEGRRKNSIYKCLDNDIEFIKEEEVIEVTMSDLDEKFGKKVKIVKEN